MKAWKMLYEALVILMVVTYGILLLSTPDNHPLLTPENMDRIDGVVIAFFLVEYIIRFVRAPYKLAFVQKNWFDLVALIPIDSAFRLARLIRLLRLLRIMKASPLLWNILQSKQIRLMLVFASVVMIWSSTGIYFLEKGLNKSISNFGDALWWSIVTTTTVGYGDISPVSLGGRIIAAFLMITGIGMIGTITAGLANHWVDYFQDSKESQDSMQQEVPDTAKGLEKEQVTEARPAVTMEGDRIRQELTRQAEGWVSRIEELSEDEYRTLLSTLDMLRQKA